MGTFYGITKMHPLVVMDGPAASGKSSLARKVAAGLGWKHLNTGGMYRALAFLMSEFGKPKEELAEEAIETISKIEFEVEGDTVKVDGRDVTSHLQDPIVRTTTSFYAAIPQVRPIMVTKQRAIACAAPCIIDARDGKSHIAPDADWCLYVSAELEKRAAWRLKDMHERGERHALQAEIQRELAARDLADMTRSVAPLEIAPEALELMSDYFVSSDSAAKQVINLLKWADKVVAMKSVPTEE